ncbi:MAG: long-chain fatty acid--CoA ligase, partial [Comamonadaceae bacterium]
AGGACILLPRFEAAAAVAAAARHRATVCATFAPMLGALLDAAATNPESLGSLRVCTGLEAPATLDRLAAICPASTFWSAYGQAEVSSMVCLGARHARAGAAGRAVAPSEIRIEDAAGLPVARGLQGEIAVRGPTVFMGYWDVRALRPEPAGGPWHRTGDLGRLDDEGWLWFEGRAPHKTLIKTGGENVYPAEVEQALLEHPEVLEAFVFGRPDERWGEAVHALCAMASGATATEAQLIAFVEAKLARFKRPQSVRFAPAPLVRRLPPA